MTISQRIRQCQIQLLYASMAYFDPLGRTARELYRRNHPRGPLPLWARTTKKGAKHA